jgi:hypothetical protein
VPEWRTQERVGSPPIGTGSSFDVTANPIETRLRELGALRDSVPALSTGSTIVRAVSGRTFAVSRIDRADRREYVAAFNSGTAPATLSFRTSTPLSAWAPLFGTTENPTSGTTGELSVTVPAVSAVLLRAERDLPTSPASAPTLTVSPDDLSNYLRLSVPVTDPTATVAFAVKRGKRAWQRVASDDSPPYRGFLDPTRYKRKEKVEAVAIVRGLDGSVAVSRVATIVPRR